jgi:hypothetical protein
MNFHSAALASKPVAAGDAGRPRDWCARQIREWLLLILRFAITREAADQSAALAIAGGIDSLALEQGWPAPSFFRRTTSEICAAIIAPHDPGRNAILARHLARIEDPRLRRAFRAAFDLDARPLPSQADNRRHLWAGLQR